MTLCRFGGGDPGGIRGGSGGDPGGSWGIRPHAGSFSVAACLRKPTKNAKGASLGGGPEWALYNSIRENAGSAAVLVVLELYAMYVWSRREALARVVSGSSAQGSRLKQ